jgi:hypothetical protein
VYTRVDHCKRSRSDMVPRRDEIHSSNLVWKCSLRLYRKSPLAAMSQWPSQRLKTREDRKRPRAQIAEARARMHRQCRKQSRLSLKLDWLNAVRCYKLYLLIASLGNTGGLVRRQRNFRLTLYNRRRQHYHCLFHSTSTSVIHLTAAYLITRASKELIIHCNHPPA